MSYISVLATDFTTALITFIVSARHEGPTLSTIPPTFTDGFLILHETRLAPEISITLCTG